MKELPLMPLSYSLKASFQPIRLRGVTAVKRLPQTIETILVYVGYSTG